MPKIGCMDITWNPPSPHDKGEDLPGFDAVIPHIGAWVTFCGTAVLRQFEMMVVQPSRKNAKPGKTRGRGTG